MNINQKIIERINAVWHLLPTEPPAEDRGALGYIREALTPEKLEERQEWDQGVTHLHEVANQRLRHYEV